MTLSFRTDRSGQTVQTQIRLLLEQQSDQGLHCLLFHLHHFDKIPLRFGLFVSSPEPKAHGELIVYQSSRRLCVCVCVCVFTFSNMNISEIRGPIATKFYLKHHWVGGKDALGFGPDPTELWCHGNV